MGIARVISKSSYGALSGSFRLSNREYGAVNYMRNRMGMNISHISEVLGRSMASVHRVIRIAGLERLDNRGQTKTSYAKRQWSFDHNKQTLRIRLKLWFAGFVDTLIEALNVPSVPIAVLDILSESRLGEDEEDPE